MPTQEEEDKDAKRRVREERRKQSGPSSSTRRESSDRKQKDRARRDGDSQASSKPGAYSSTELSSPRSKKASAKSRSSAKSSSGTIDKSDRSDRSDRHSPKSRTSKPAIVPGAVSSSTSSPHARRERRKAGADDSSRSSRSTPVDDTESSKSRSSGIKNRTSRPATSPGAVTSTSSPQSRKERRKTGKDAAARSSSRSTSTRDPDAVQRKLLAAGLLDEEEIATEPPSKTMETTEEGEVLLQATTVDENEESKPKMRDVELVGETQTPAPTETEEPPPPEPKKRRYGIIIFAVVVLGAGAAAGAYFGTRGSSNPAVVPDSTLSPTVENITLTPTTSPPTDPPSQGYKYPPPDDDACQRIASGLNREPKTDIVKNYELTMDVELSDQESQLDSALSNLEKRMQEVFVPALAGCSDVAVRQINIRYVIYNGLVSLSLTRQSSSCELNASASCYVVVASLALELQGEELSRSIESIIEDTEGQEDNLVSKWQLETPIIRLTVTKIELVDETESPSENPTSISSVSPTNSPFSENPTSAPVAGTNFPSVTPTTSSPTVAASENPTLAPVVGPTTEEPTDLPSSAPSSMPSGMPSRNPTMPPTPLPSLSPTKAPTPEPSVIPTLAPTFEPMEGDHLQSSHYVYYMPEPPDAPVYPYNSREEAQAACETKGLTLCSKSAITNFPLCSIGWLTDDRGLWSIGNGCGFGGFTDGGFFGIFDRGGAYCCGRPLFLPEDGTYIYNSREEGRAACQTRGLGLCSKEQITGYENCQYGWLTDDVGLWMNTGRPGCGPGGFDPTIFPNNGAYCCVERPVTQAPSVTPSVAPSPPPSVAPSSRPSFELMEGDHLLNEHYVYYMPDGENPPVYPYNSREEAQAACESKGLALCNKSAITNFPLCSIGWLTDDRGLWSIGNGCGFGGFTDGGFFGIFDRGGAYCCGRPLFMPENDAYIYYSREEGLAACQTRGLGLCSKEQLTGFENCQYGWLTDDVGLWMNTGRPGCGPTGFHSTIFPNNGAYCCAAPP